MNGLTPTALNALLAVQRSDAHERGRQDGFRSGLNHGLVFGFAFGALSAVVALSLSL